MLSFSNNIQTVKAKHWNPPIGEFTDHPFNSFKFKCRHCSVFKTQDCYSKNEIAPYKHTLSQNPGMKPDSIKPLLRCRSCKGEQVQELECQGPCGQVKVLDLFSKAQRSRGNKWCMECVHWKEGHHPEVDLTSAPGSEPAPHATTPPPVETTGSYAASMAAVSISPIFLHFQLSWTISCIQKYYMFKSRQGSLSTDQY